MIEQVNQTKQRPLCEWFGKNIPADAISLVIRMLQFNPFKRPTANEILKNSYLKSFANSKQEFDSKKVIRPSVSDNNKLNVKDYRNLIYDHIRKVYREK